MAAGQVPRLEDGQWDQRRLRGRLPGDEQPQQRERDRAQQQRRAVAPALLGRGLHDRVGADHQRRGDQKGTDHVGALAEADSLVALDVAAREQRGDDRDRDVDEEDPVPVDRLGEDAADQEPDGAAARGDEREQAHGLRLFAGLGEHGRDHPEDHRRGQSPADSLEESCTDQQARAVREPTEHRGCREQGEPGEEDGPAPDQVAEPAREQEEAAERDQVGVDDPGEVVLAEPEVVLDRRKRDVDDGDVEDDHQHARAQHVEGNPSVAVVLHLGRCHRFPPAFSFAGHVHRPAVGLKLIARRGLRLPERDLAAGAVELHAPPARGALARLEEDVRPELARALGHRGDLGDLDVG